jgi:putative transposase
VLLDPYSRKIIGWAVSENIDRALVVAVLQMAIKILDKNGFHVSCSARRNPYHNACSESFMKTLKEEEVYMGNYEVFLDVVENIPQYINEVYNKKTVALQSFILKINFCWIKL